MDPDFQEDLLAELLALNQAVHQALHQLADLSGDRAAFLSQQLEAGLEGLGQVALHGAGSERNAVVVEKARARFTDIVGSIPR